MSVEELRKQLETIQRSHEALLQSLATPAEVLGPSSNAFSNPRLAFVSDRRKTSEVPPPFDSSTLSDDSDEEDEDYFVQSVLPSQSFDHEHLREHLKRYEWDYYGRQVLSTLMTDRGRLKEPQLFPTHQGPAEDRSHYSHYQVYDVGADGVPHVVEAAARDNSMSKASEIWHLIKDINADRSKKQLAVGRITIAREPSPILFGALHLTMHKSFDVDELFMCLVESEASSAYMIRAFHEDPRRQRSFVFNFEYYTIIGEDCKPMQWQLSDKNRSTSESHLPLTRCSSVVALSLYGEPLRKIRNRARRVKTRYGFVYNPWAAWQVLNIQCYPDWKATTDTHESGNRYLNGPEAFLHTLLTEYKDAQARFEEIYKRITKLITPPLDFIFNDDLRDKRLFEDETFTWTRRYFWAHQTLGTMNDSIKSMVDAFEDTFTEDVWEGRNKTLWPLYEESPRNEFWKRRLRSLKLAFEREIKGLRMIILENNERRAEIKALQGQLFSGTSVLESRKSVELSDITVQQGRNIKLLTLVNIFFLPLTFVTSVFGMTNMPTEHSFRNFGVTMATVCIPFFFLIAFLNTDSGYSMWMRKTQAMWRWLRPKKKVKADDTSTPKDLSSAALGRTRSTEKGMQVRLARQPLRGKSFNEHVEIVPSPSSAEEEEVRRKTSESGSESRLSNLEKVHGAMKGDGGPQDAIIGVKDV